jgi:hypothetical protein
MFISCITICTFNWFSISWHVLRSPSKSFYEHPVNVIPFFQSFSVKIPLDIHSKHPTLFITISYIEMFTHSGHKLSREKIKFATPRRMSRVQNSFRRKVSHPMNNISVYFSSNYRCKLNSLVCNNFLQFMK